MVVTNSLLITIMMLAVMITETVTAMMIFFFNDNDDDGDTKERRRVNEGRLKANANPTTWLAYLTADPFLFLPMSSLFLVWGG